MEETAGLEINWTLPTVVDRTTVCVNKSLIKSQKVWPVPYSRPFRPYRTCLGTTTFLAPLTLNRPSRKSRPTCTEPQGSSKASRYRWTRCRSWASASRRFWWKRFLPRCPWCGRRRGGVPTEVTIINFNYCPYRRAHASPKWSLVTRIVRVVIRSPVVASDWERILFPAKRSSLVVS